MLRLIQRVLECQRVIKDMLEKKIISMVVKKKQVY